MPLDPGTRLGPYEVVSPLGAGGMGEVYRARHLKLGRDVAVKVLPDAVAADPDRRQRFEREARAASALNHPNVVTIHDIDEQDGVHFIAMELVEGSSLRQLLAEGPLPLGRLLPLARQLAEGLAKAHAAGIVHRDLKPENLMVTDDCLLKILDFGLAKLSPRDVEEGDSELSTVEQATRAGMVLGTVPYMSPEQAAGRAVDFRSDQFSFGTILYEMATGRRAFKKETTPQTLAAIIEGEPQPLGRLSPALPAQFVAIVERCLAKDPGRRFGSTRELAGALQSVPEIPARSPRRGWALWTAAGLVAVALAAALLPRVWDRWRRAGPAEAPAAIHAVAVLPLQNLSGDPEQAYFADGMTEALITDLARIGALKVISRSSVMRYRNTDTPPAEIAKELGVDALIEGSAQRSGDRVRITAQLVDPHTNQALWADSYERAFTDTLRLQGEVAQAIARQIGAALTPEERSLLAERRRVAPEAMEAYLRGMFHLQRFTPQDFDAALRFFQTALEIDPDYAAAHAGIARVWSFRMTAGIMPPREAGPKALAAARHAVELDDRLSEAYAVLAGLEISYEWDWKAGEAALRRAIAINPSNAEARVFYSHVLTLLGRIDEGTEQMERGLELDPLNPFYQTMAAAQQIMAGRFDDGIARIQTTLEKTPGFGFGHVPLWAALHHQGRYEEALQALKNHYARARRETDVVEALDRGNAAGGYREALRRAAETLERRSRTTYVPAIPMVDLYDKAGNTDKALEWLERAYETRAPTMPYLAVVPHSDELRRDPRFRDMLRRMKLPDLRPVAPSPSNG